MIQMVIETWIDKERTFLQTAHFVLYKDVQRGEKEPIKKNKFL